MWADQALLQNFVVSLLAGLFIFLVALNWSFITSYLKRDRAAFRRIFGSRAVKTGILTITLDTYRDSRLISPQPSIQDELEVQLNGQVGGGGNRFFKRFPDGHLVAFPEAFGDILGYCSSRAAAHLLEGLVGVPGIMIRTVSDSEVASQWSGAFVNIGSSASNIKTDQVKHLPENSWLAEDAGGRFEFKDGHEITAEDRADKGIVLKLDNPYFPGYSVLVCTGLGEWGTSGAAWFLSTKWRTLSRRFGKNPFLLVVSVMPGSDESTREILFFGKESLSSRIRSRLRAKKRVAPSETALGKTPDGERADYRG